MRRKTEIPFAFDKGVVTGIPEISSQEFLLSKLENVVPVFNRLKLFRSHLNYVDVPNNETVRAIATIFNLSTQILEGYIITDTTVYKLSAVDNFLTLVGTITGVVDELSVDGEILSVDGEDLIINAEGSFAFRTDNPHITWTSWEDTTTIYFTRPGLFLSKIENNTLSQVIYTYNDGAGLLGLSARYSLMSGNRLFLANITTSDQEVFSRRLQWSDLFNPEDFEINRAKEGDFYDLENSNLEITGLHEHRGYPVIFSRRSIWRAVYLGPPQIYRFEPVRNNIGNIYHQASITAKERVYFIGEDNFYVLDGFSTIPIGDAIWNKFIEINESSTLDEVLAFHDPFQGEVSWKFLRAGDSSYTDYRQDTHFWLVVYNYKENRWSYRSADGMESYNVNTYTVRQSVTIDSITTLIDDDTNLIDGDWQDINIPSSILIGREGEVSLYQQGGFVDKDNAALIAEIESHELFYESLMDSKEVSEIKLSYSAVGNPVVKVSIGYRNNQKETLTWTPEFQEQVITGENEIRFLLERAIRAKFIKIRITVENTSTDYFEELNGGSMLLTGMKDKGTEI